MINARKWLSRFRGSRAVRFDRVHPQERFDALLVRECSRADRSGTVFSVVLFETAGEQESRWHAYHLVAALQQRIRLTDEIGWSGDGRLGVFLPDTTAEGAERLAREISRTLAADASEPGWTIHTYPDDCLPGSRIAAQVTRLGTHPRNANSSAQPFVDARGQTRPPPPYSQELPGWKRAMDIVGALVGIVLLAPLMLVVALAVKLTSPGPVIFRQQRIGHCGRTFDIYKFRSMTAGASEALHVDYVRRLVLGRAEAQGDGALKLTADPRVTRVGAFLRKWSLDELPQLFNVLKGEMSLVGPRPDPAYASHDYRRWYHRRTLHVKPGITGLWQVKGRSRVAFEEMVRLDLRYSQSVSFARDVWIILHTFRAVFSHAGAY